jgi:hypothetical protein
LIPLLFYTTVEVDFEKASTNYPKDSICIAG